MLNATGLPTSIEVRTGSLPLPEPAEFHLVVANLIASVLVDLAQPLAGSVFPGGRLLAGGIFKDREAEVSSALASAGLRVVGSQAEGDWLTLEFERA